MGNSFNISGFLLHKTVLLQPDPVLVDLERCTCSMRAAPVLQYEFVESDFWLVIRNLKTLIYEFIYGFNKACSKIVAQAQQKKYTTIIAYTSYYQ